MCLHIKCSAKYSTTVSVAILPNMDVGRGALGPICPPFCQFYKKVVLRLSEHGDVIETQTLKVYSPSIFCQTRSLVAIEQLQIYEIKRR